jgi:phosphoribosylformylglycinamidine cyclo-ligase
MEADQVDLAATALGVVEKGGELGSHRVGAGDVVIGLISPNLRSNGFSLVRAVVGDRDLQEIVEGRPLIEWLMEASVIYSPAVLKAVGTGKVHAAAHITGGGLLANLARVIPGGHEAIINFDAWQPPRVFQLVAELGDLPTGELRKVLNMGIGFCLITAPDDADAVIELCGHDARVIGRVAAV